MFEESGPLGKGITVGKVQVALSSSDRSASSIFGMLESKARAGGSSPAQLSRLSNDVCLSLLRKSDDWISACSASEWFGQDDAGKAESLFNDWANREAAKFEKVGFGSNAWSSYTFFYCCEKGLFLMEGKSLCFNILSRLMKLILS